MSYYPQWHPYRDPRDLATLIPPDRRLVKTAILATVCFLGGAMLLAAIELAMAAAVDPSGQLVRRDRDLKLVAGHFEPSAPPTFVRPMGMPLSRMTDLAREAALRGDMASVRSILLPVVASGRGSFDDVRLLRAACQGLHDQACVQLLNPR